MSVLVSDQPRARSVDFMPGVMVVHLLDGRSLSIPIEWSPKLREATPEQKGGWRLIGDGIGIHWEELDEDISVRALLVPSQPALHPGQS